MLLEELWKCQESLNPRGNKDTMTSCGSPVDLVRKTWVPELLSICLVNCVRGCEREGVLHPALRPRPLRLEGHSARQPDQTASALE